MSFGDYFLSIPARVIIFIRRVIGKIFTTSQKYLFSECGYNVYIGVNGKFTYKNIKIGHDVYIGENANFISSISKIHIGNYVMFGPNVTIRGGDHRIDILGEYMINVTEDMKNINNDRDIYIGNDVWIGTNVTILKGVRIGEGSVIGAGSVITKDVPSYSIHVGVHQPFEKRRFSDEEIILHKNRLRSKFL